MHTRPARIEIGLLIWFSGKKRRPLLFQNNIWPPQVRDVRQGYGVQKVEVGGPDAPPGVMGGARIARIALFSASKNTGHPGTVPVKQFHDLEHADLGGIPLQPIPAAISARGIDNPLQYPTSTGFWTGSWQGC
jgi:hypothetical protein